MSRDRIHILHVIDSLAVGGMERVVIDVANSLDPARFAQSVCCLSRRGAAADQLAPRVRCFDLGKGGRADYLMPLKIRRLLRQERPDIVHTQSWSGIDALIARGLAPGARLVHSEHGRSLPDLDGGPWRRRIARRVLYEAADAVFAVSAEVRDHYCRQTGFARERMTVIPNGVDLRRFDGARDADRVDARREFGFRAEDFVLGTIARLDATKNTIALLQAFAVLHAERGGPANLRLLIVGDGPERTRLQTFVEEQALDPAVVFAGQRHDVPRLLAALDGFALSSLTEGLPITVLEAMGASLPVVATPVGALPDLIEEGETGFLAAPPVFAARLGVLYDDPALARRLGAAGRRKAEREYGIERMLRRYEDLYLRLASGNL